MTEPADLLRQMHERSERKLRLPKNMAKGDWVGDTSRALLTRVAEEIAELAQEMATLDEYLRGYTHITDLEGDPVRGVEGFPPTLQQMWDAIADEAQDVYAMASMGADPRRYQTLRELGVGRR